MLCSSPVSPLCLFTLLRQDSSSLSSANLFKLFFSLLLLLSLFHENPSAFPLVVAKGGSFMLCLSEHPPVLLLLLLLLLMLSSEMLRPSGRLEGVSLRGKLLLLQGKSNLCVFMGKCTDTADDVAAAASLLNLLVGDNNDELEQPANILYKKYLPTPKLIYVSDMV
ncbi:hypothetical protein YC2023_114859 [Brassica napus]